MSSHSQQPKVTEQLIEDIGLHIEELVDLKHMIVAQMSADKALMNKVFFEVGEKEFKFVTRSGLYFGGLFGIIQMLVWIIWPALWVLPFFGLLVGLATNWIALNFIFRPLKPVRLGFFTIQGLFLKRQKEVSATICRLVTREVLTLQRIMDEMMHGPRKERTQILIKKHIRPMIDNVSVLRSLYYLKNKLHLRSQ